MILHLFCREMARQRQSSLANHGDQVIAVLQQYDRYLRQFGKRIHDLYNRS